MEWSFDMETLIERLQQRTQWILGDIALNRFVYPIFSRIFPHTFVHKRSRTMLWQFHEYINTWEEEVFLKYLNDDFSEKRKFRSWHPFVHSYYTFHRIPKGKKKEKIEKQLKKFLT